MAKTLQRLAESDIPSGECPEKDENNGELIDFDMSKRCRCPDAAQWCADNAYGVLGAGAAKRRKWMFP